MATEPNAYERKQEARRELHLDADGQHLVAVEYDADDNRIRLIFPAKPDDATRAIVKNWGFKWARSLGAWQRQWTAAGEAATCGLLDNLRAKPNGT